MSRRWAECLALLSLLLAACTGQGPPRPPASAIEIGVDVPMTGPQADLATATVDVVRATVERAFGGRIQGRPVVIRILDESPAGRRDPVGAAAALGRAALDPNLLGVIGPLDSDVAQAEIPVAGDARLALVSPAASNACLTKSLPECDGLAKRLRASGPASFFRVLPADDGEAAAMVQYASRNLRSTRFAVGSDGSAYGVLMRGRFEAAIKQERLDAVFSGDLDPNSDAGVAAFLAAAKQAGADTVVFGGRAGGGACKVAAALPGALGAGASFLGAAGIQSESCEKDAGAGATIVYAPQEGGPELSAEAARVLLDAISAAVKLQGGNTPSREQVRLAVSRSAVVAFDANGDVRNARYTILRGVAPVAGQPSQWESIGTG